MTTKKSPSTFGTKKILSPEYSSYHVRLSTFGRFPLITGVNVRTIAAAGFFYTGHGDVVRCYACDGGLKHWVPGDDPWEEHYRWFPDCSHLDLSNYRPLNGEANAAENNKPKDTVSALTETTAPSEGLIRRLDTMAIAEKTRMTDVMTDWNSSKTKYQEWELDMNSPAVLAVLDHGYSKQAVQVAITELRQKGRNLLTAMSILDVLLSHEDIQNQIPKDNFEHHGTQNLERKQETTDKDLTEEISSTKTSSKDTQLRFLMEENVMLTSRMTCKRCRKRNKSILVLPCTHFCLCEQCSMEVSLCPECWKPIHERVKTYIP